MRISTSAALGAVLIGGTCVLACGPAPSPDAAATPAAPTAGVEPAPAATMDPSLAPGAAEAVAPPEPDPLASLRATGDLVCPQTIAGAELTARAVANEDWIGAEAHCVYGPVWSEAPEQANLRFEIVLTATDLEAARAAAAGQEAEELGGGARRLLARRLETVRVGEADRAAEVIMLEDVEAAPDWMPFTRTRLALWVVDLGDGRALALASDHAATAQAAADAASLALLAAQGTAPEP